MFKNFYSEKKEGRKATNSLFKLGVIFSITFLFLFSLNFSLALDSLGEFESGQSVRISQVCSDATYINISSVAYPNSSVAVANIAMTSAGDGEYYYDFTSTTDLGRYDVRGVSDGCEKTFATYFEISGGDIGLFLIIIGVSLVLLLFAFLFKSPWLSFASGALMIISGIYVMGYGLYFFSDLYTRSIAYTLIGIGLFFAIISGFEVFQEDW